MICAIISDQSIVINTIVVESMDFEAPSGCIAIDVTDRFCGIGFVFDPVSGDFIDTRIGE